MHYTIKFMFCANKNKVSQVSLFSPLQKAPDKNNKANEIFRQLLVKFQRLNSWLIGKIFSAFQQLINISPLWPCMTFVLLMRTHWKTFFFKNFPCSQILVLNSNKMELVDTSISLHMCTHKWNDAVPVLNFSWIHNDIWTFLNRSELFSKETDLNPCICTSFKSPRKFRLKARHSFQNLC